MTDFNKMVGNVMLGIGALMTIGLFFFFRWLLRQVRKEAAMVAKNESEKPAEPPKT